MNLTTLFISCSYDGSMRYGKSACTQGRHGTVLLLMGWGEWIEKYTEVIQNWNNRGYDIIIAEWRGQGLSSRFLMDRTKTWLPSFDLLVDDLDRLFKTELAQTPNVILLCHSMGAHIGLRWFLERGRKYSAIKGVMLASPLHYFNTYPLPPILAILVIHAAIWFGLDQAHVYGQKEFNQTSGRYETNPLTTDEPAYRMMIEQLNQQPTLKVGGFTYGWLYALLQSVKRLELDLSRGAPRIAYMVMGSEDDMLVDARCFAQIASMLPHCKTHILAGAKHELLREAPELRRQTWQWMDDFVAGI